MTAGRREGWPMPGFDNCEAYKYNMYANVSAHNNTRWATDDEMKNSLREIVINERHYSCGGIPLLSDGKVAYVDSSDTHSLILGATGSKKSRLLCMPLLQILAKAGESIIATDPKGELYGRTSGILKENGYKLVALNFRNPSFGDAWNPLALPYRFYQAGEKDKAAETLNDFVFCNITNKSADPFWEQTAGNFCFGLLWLLLECAREEEVNVRSLAFLRTYAKAFENDGPLDFLYNFLNKQSLAAISLSGTLNSADKTRSSILVTFDQMFRIFSAQQNLSEMLSHSSFNLDRIGLEKTAVFLIMPDEKSTYHFLVSIFIKQCYESLIRVAQEQPGRALPIRTNF
ncbi:type IV secretory system conjugative DNA transfer family protein, partial [Candidatus Gracilibacteria bacterium]|nr:type IV secretory system conjugative DNA transfer family protein [Candidatus Gracilibacteria bacterium]